MATPIRAPFLRNVLRNPSSQLRGPQRRWARVHDVRFLATHRDPDQVLEKYKEKLDKKAKEEGHGSLSSLKEAYKEKITELRRSAATVVSPEIPPSTGKIASTSPFPPPPPPPSPAKDAPASKPSSPNIPKSAVPGIKPLSSYLDMDKIRELPSKEIELIWRLRHAKDPNSLCAVVPIETYQRISQTAKSNPQFILPLPRTVTEAEGEEATEPVTKTGADIHFLQWAFHPPASPPENISSGKQTLNTHTSTVIFTHLAAYQLHGTYAQPHTTITHHLDLADSHGLVLLKGSIVPDRGVSIDEGRWLVMCLQRFYDFEGEGKGRRGELLKMFSKGDTEGFSVEELVEEAEKIG